MKLTTLTLALTLLAPSTLANPCDDAIKELRTALNTQTDIITLQHLSSEAIDVCQKEGPTR